MRRGVTLVEGVLALAVLLLAVLTVVPASVGGARRVSQSSYRLDAHELALQRIESTAAALCAARFCAPESLGCDGRKGREAWGNKEVPTEETVRIVPSAHTPGTFVITVRLCWIESRGRERLPFEYVLKRVVHDPSIGQEMP